VKLRASGSRLHFHPAGRYQEAERAQRIYLKSLNLNMTKPAIVWDVTAKSWFQQWPTREGKKLAQQVARRHPLGMLTWYLGDGEKHPDTFRIAVGDARRNLDKATGTGNTQSYMLDKLRQITRLA
jgi:hypothetical protein